MLSYFTVPNSTREDKASPMPKSGFAQSFLGPERKVSDSESRLRLSSCYLSTVPMPRRSSALLRGHGLNSHLDSRERRIENGLDSVEAQRGGHRSRALTERGGVGARRRFGTSGCAGLRSACNRALERARAVEPAAATWRHLYVARRRSPRKASPSDGRCPCGSHHQSRASRSSVPCDRACKYAATSCARRFEPEFPDSAGHRRPAC
jgi:hypothetical protein